MPPGVAFMRKSGIFAVSFHFVVSALAIAFILSVSVQAQAASIMVGPEESIQDAIDRAGPGETILVKGGVHMESLSINRSVHLVGEDRTRIDAGATNCGVVLLSGAKGSSVSGFEIRSSGGIGIYILSDDNSISNNSITGCLDAIRIERAAHNQIRGNSVNNNTNGIVLYDSNENVIEENLVQDNDRNEESDCGITLAYSHKNAIVKNELTNNGDAGISLRASSNNTISENRISRNDWYGILLTQSSDGNRIAENEVFENEDSGIYLEGSRYNILKANRAADGSRGICLSFDSNENALVDNRLTSNEKGLHLAHHSSNNTIANNTADENGYGIYLSFSAGWNLIHSNHLRDNKCNAYDLGQSNRWDDGIVGNYYDDLGRLFYVPGGAGIDRHPMAEP